MMKKDITIFTLVCQTCHRSLDFTLLLVIFFNASALAFLFNLFAIEIETHPCTKLGSHLLGYNGWPQVGKGVEL